MLPDFDSSMTSSTQIFPSASHVHIFLVHSCAIILEEVSVAL